MGLIEAIFPGRSLGELITGTAVAKEDGSRISGQTTLLRGLCRLFRSMHSVHWVIRVIHGMISESKHMWWIIKAWFALHDFLKLVGHNRRIIMLVINRCGE
jgi:uncharacterized RDD family membrane protein YckC